MLQSIPQEVDVIIAGGGTSGGVLAARLAKANPELSILLIEAGPHTKDNPQVIHPALLLSHLVPDSQTAKFHLSKASPHVAGREIVVASGGALGGSSSINFAMYWRGSASDYDGWNSKGWSAEELKPFLRKLESFHISGKSIDQSIHGYDGEFKISQSGTFPDQSFRTDALKAAASAGWKLVEDHQDLKTGNAGGPMASWVDPRTGRRQDVPHVLIYPLLEAKSTKLEVLTSTKVVRVLFDSSKRAIGVEVASELHGTSIIKAKQSVIISAGALGSPLILERSGVGDPRVISGLGTPLNANVPGVGTNYQDHALILYPYKSSIHPTHSLDGFYDGRFSVPEIMSTSPNLLGWNGIEASAKLRPTADELRVMHPDLQRLWDKDFKDYEDRPLGLVTCAGWWVADHGNLPKEQYICFATHLSYPYSRGSIHATGLGVNDKPDFDAGLFEQEVDIDPLVWLYKKQREVARRMTLYAGGIEELHPAFRSGSAASFDVDDDLLMQSRSIPEKLGALQDLTYSSEDVEAIRRYLRNQTGPGMHSLGTCAMKPFELGGVVDERLNVYGVNGLKVVDLSIAPNNIGCNTYGTALLIGEKAAAIVAEDLGLQI